MWKEVEDREADKTKVEEAVGEERKKRNEEANDRGGDSNSKDKGEERRGWQG